jgi:hypothetical protein
MAEPDLAVKRIRYIPTYTFSIYDIYNIYFYICKGHKPNIEEKFINFKSKYTRYILIYII